MNFVFLGPPGAGKGTLAAVVASRFGIFHVSTGAIFREAIKNQTELGKKVKAIIDSGGLVSDDLTVALVQERLASLKTGFILDGFPRTTGQAEALKNFAKIDGVVNFELDDDTVIRRLAGRRVCKNCGKNYHVEFTPPKVEGTCDACGGELYIRDDDKPEAIRKRLMVYNDQTAPLIEFYGDEIVPIDASKAPDEVLEEFVSKFNLNN